jgi:hypothetical protein
MFLLLYFLGDVVSKDIFLHRAELRSTLNTYMSEGIHQTLLRVDPWPIFKRLRSVLRSRFTTAQPRSKKQNDPLKVGIYQSLLGKHHFVPKQKR